MQNADLKELLQVLREWYWKGHRDLPWRNTKNPYHIWVSEIMLQQTRVEAVKPYYARFLQELPTIKDLAEAEEEVILKLWEGLGYYSRVRNMQTAAKQVMEQHGGKMPADHKALLQLKGIGSYTAGAVASIAFDLPYAAVDGNVLRVLSRVYADDRDILLQQTKKAWETELNAVLTEEIAGDVNQALMELGATVCVPNGMPKCELCPWRAYCVVYAKNTMLQYPVKTEKKPRTKVELSVCFLTDGKKIALRKRGSKGLLANLWELPNIEKEYPLPAALVEWGIPKAEIATMKGQKHIFTHIEWHMDCYYILVEEKEETPFTWVELADMTEQYALPSAFKKIWQEGLQKMEQNKQISLC